MPLRVCSGMTRRGLRFELESKIRVQEGQNQGIPDLRRCVAMVEIENRVIGLVAKAKPQATARNSRLTVFVDSDKVPIQFTLKYGFFWELSEVDAVLLHTMPKLCEETGEVNPSGRMRALGPRPASGRNKSFQKYYAENHSDLLPFHSAKSLSRQSNGRLVPDPVGPMLAPAVGNNSHISGQYSSSKCRLLFYAPS